MVGEIFWLMTMGKEAAQIFNKYRLAVDLTAIVIGFLVSRFILLFVPMKLANIPG